MSELDDERIEALRQRYDNIPPSVAEHMGTADLANALAELQRHRRRLMVGPVPTEEQAWQLFWDGITAMASGDRERTIKTLLQALDELNIVRPVFGRVVYDHRLIGSHAAAREQVASEIGAFLLLNDVIDWTRQRTKDGGTEMQGSIVIVLPERLRQATPPADKEQMQ